jgi:hypothetical protein
LLDVEGQLLPPAITPGHALLEDFIERKSENQDNDNDADITDSENKETTDSPHPSQNSGVTLGYIYPANVASRTAIEPTNF